MRIHEQLIKIQQGLHVPKDKNNKFGGFRYRNAEQILAAAKPLLDGCTIILNDEVVSIGDRVYVKATALLSDGEAGISASAFAREPLIKKGMDEPQVTGTASSYARKYALCGLFAIDSSDTKDADETPQPTLLEQINACMNRDDLIAIYKQMTPDEQNNHAAEFKARGEQLEKEA